MASNKITPKAHIGNGSNHGGIALKSETHSKGLGNEVTIQFVYQGLKDGLLTAANALTIGGKDDNYGYLTTWEIKPDTGPFWNLIVNYSSNNPYAITVSIGTASSTSDRTYTCNTIMKSMPLQTKSNYKYIWNHVLIYLDTKTAGGSAYSPPAYNTVAALNSSDYKSIINASNGHLKWIKEANEMPTEPVYQEEEVNGETVQVPHYWKIAYECSKPGVDYYQMPVYEITQASRTTQQPEWWRNNKPGKVVPPHQTFGINTGEWLCHGGQMRYDGKVYDASCTYQWTPGTWDTDLYDAN